MSQIHGAATSGFEHARAASAANFEQHGGAAAAGDPTASSFLDAVDAAVG